MRTTDLIGPALDWAVAKCEKDRAAEVSNNPMSFKWKTNAINHYSTAWAQGGPIIEREKINTRTSVVWAGVWRAATDRGCAAEGPTPLIAAMRCFVASTLGDEVDVPEDLK